MNINIRWADNTADLQKNLKQGLDQIEATKAAADKLVRSLGGDTLIAAAHKYAAAVEQLGGAAKLTVANQERVHEVMTKALGVLTAAGKGTSDLAKHFADLAAATAAVKAPLDAAKGMIAGMSASYKEFAKTQTDSARMVAGMAASYKDSLAREAAATKEAADAAAKAKAPLDAMAAGLSKAGQAATDSARMISGMSASGKAALDKETASIKALADAAERAKAPLDKMAAGMSRGGNDAFASGKMIAGMGAIGRTTFVDLEKQAKDNANAWGTLGQQWSALGTGAKALGGVLVASLTVPIVAMGAAVTKAAMDFDTSFAGVRKTVDGVVGYGGKLTTFGVQLGLDFRQLAKEIPITVVELNRIGEAAGQLGIRGEDILQFTKTMAMLGTTSNLTSDAAAAGIAKIQNIFQAAGKETDRFGSALIALGIDSAATESTILEFATRIAGMAKLAGMTQADVLGIATAMASVGIEAEAGGTAVQRVIQKMVTAVTNGGSSLEAFARQAGMSGAAFQKAFDADPAKAFNEWVLGLSRAGRGAIAMLDELGLTNQRLVRSFFSLAGAGDSVNRYVDESREAWAKNTALVTAAAEKYQAFSAQLQLFKNRVNDVGITLGDVMLRIGRNLLDVVDPLIKKVEHLAKTFADLPVPVQNSTVAVGGILATIPLAVFGFGTLAGAAGNLATAMQTLGIASKAGMTAWAAGAVPWVAIPAAIAGITWSIKQMTGDWTSAFAIMMPPIAGIMRAWQDLQKNIAAHPKEVEAVKSIYQSLSSLLRDEVAISVDDLKKAFEGVKSAFSTFTQGVRDTHPLLDTLATKLGGISGKDGAIAKLKQAFAEAFPLLNLVVTTLERAANLDYGKIAKGFADVAGGERREADQRRGFLSGTRNPIPAPAPGTNGPIIPVAPGDKPRPLPTNAEARKLLDDLRDSQDKLAYSTENLQEKVDALSESDKAKIVTLRQSGEAFSDIAKDVKNATNVVTLYYKQQAGDPAVKARLKKDQKDFNEAWAELNALEETEADLTGRVDAGLRGLILHYKDLGATVETMVKAHVAEKGVIEGVLKSNDKLLVQKKRLLEIEKDHKIEPDELPGFVPQGYFDSLQKALAAQKEFREKLAAMTDLGLKGELEAIERKRKLEIDALGAPPKVMSAAYRDAVIDINRYFDALRADAIATSESIESVFAKAAAGADRVPPKMNNLLRSTALLVDAFNEMGKAAGGSFGIALAGAGQLMSLIVAAQQASWALNNEPDKTKTQKGGDLANRAAATKAAAIWAGVGYAFNTLADNINTQGTPYTNTAVKAGGLPGHGYQPGSNVGASTPSLVNAGAARGAAIGAPFAPMTFGISIGVGAAVGAVVGWVQSGKEWRKVVNDVGKAFAGLHVPEEFAKAIEDIEATTGLKRAQAIATQLDQLITMVGGLNDANFDMFTAKLREVFDFVARGEMTVAQATEVLDKNFANFVAAGTDASGFLADSLKEIIRLDQQAWLNPQTGPSTRSKAIAEYLKGQGAVAVNASNAIIGSLEPRLTEWAERAARIAKARKGGADQGKFTEDDGTVRDMSKKERDAFIADLAAQKAAAAATSHELENMGIIAVATFAAAVASGATFNEAMAAAGPGLEQLQLAFESLGISTENVALKALLMQATLRKDNPALITGIAGLAAGFAALSNMGLLNVETFKAMTETGAEMYKRLLDEAQKHGGGARDALLPMQEYLHNAQKAAEELGIPLDENTLLLIAQSKELGIWKEKGKSATDKMIDAMETLAKKVERLVNVLLGIPDVDYDVTQHNHTTDDPPKDKDKGGGGAGAGPGAGQGGTGGGADTGPGGDDRQGFATGVDAIPAPFGTTGTDLIPAMLSPRELVITEAQTGRLGAALAQGNLLRLDMATPTRTEFDQPAAHHGPLEIVIEIDGQRLGKTVFDPRNLSGTTRQRFRAAVHEVGSEVAR